jgi:hypothetical protein
MKFQMQTASNGLTRSTHLMKEAHSIPELTSLAFDSPHMSTPATLWIIATSKPGPTAYPLTIYVLRIWHTKEYR